MAEPNGTGAGRDGPEAGAASGSGAGARSGPGSGAGAGSATAAARSGPHRVLIAFYALFTLAAGARSAVQLAEDAGRAPVAYTLSAVAACTYAAGWYAIRKASEGATGFASVMLWVELSGVVVVGTLSLFRREWFPEPSVWSDYGIGYGFVPLILPIAGLWWLHRYRAAHEAADGNTEAA